MLNLLYKLNQIINDRVNNFCPQFLTFAIFGLINYPVYYIIWIVINENNYENFTLRLIATFLCLGLLLKNQWPENWKKWLPLYWYFTLTYCVPFFFTFMWLHNPESKIWIMTFASITFWLVLLTDLPSAFFLLFIGLIAAFSTFILNNDASFLPGYLYELAPEYIGCLIVIAIFANNKARFEKGKLESMRELAATIAHELRTPLATIQVNAEIIEENYHAPDSKSPISATAANSNIIQKSLNYIKKEVALSNTFINMLLVKVEPSSAETSELTACSIQTCVNEAIARYPFHDTEKTLIHWQKNAEFDFYGKELMMIHLLFNLFKNALHAIAAAGKGDITIWVTPGKRYNALHFKDTGTGIPANIRSKIFNRFFSTTTHGSGVGLQYCKEVMQTLGGKITVDSVENEYTEFVLYFPHIKE